jgi:hypothetical protein
VFVSCLLPHDLKIFLFQAGVQMRRAITLD